MRSNPELSSPRPDLLLQHHGPNIRPGRQRRTIQEKELVNQRPKPGTPVSEADFAAAVAADAESDKRIAAKKLARESNNA